MTISDDLRLLAYKQYEDLPDASIKEGHLVNEDGDAVVYVSVREIEDIASRIESEMIGLPTDADGGFIKYGNTVYTRKGEQLVVSSIRYCGFGNWIINAHGEDGINHYYPDELTHAGHVSIGDVACKIDNAATAIDNSNGEMYISPTTLRKWSAELRNAGGDGDE